ncbi:MAG: hypothetical protein ACXWVT_08410 [Burkholderiaceae bacterium]
MPSDQITLPKEEVVIAGAASYVPPRSVYVSPNKPALRLFFHVGVTKHNPQHDLMPSRRIVVLEGHEHKERGSRLPNKA